jgi:anti-anti-sigma regulatory factor
VTYRIHRVATSESVVFTVSGEMDTEHAARFQELLADEASERIVLDLREVTIVDRAAVRFLARVEAGGVRIVNCPGYVRSWIAAERDRGPSGRPGPEEGEP